jgi:hypothetical protein
MKMVDSGQFLTSFNQTTDGFSVTGMVNGWIENHPLQLF